MSRLLHRRAGRVAGVVGPGGSRGTHLVHRQALDRETYLPRHLQQPRVVAPRFPRTRPGASRLIRQGLALAVALALGFYALSGPIPQVLAHSSYDESVDITMPVEGDYSDDYAAGRAGGRVHRATDIFAPMWTEVHAAMGGTVSWAPHEEHPTAGFALQIQGDDGRMYAYYHLGEADGSRADALADGIEDGTRVERGQLIGYLGNSGNARTTPPHLHFEIHDQRIDDPYGSNRVNPYASLRAAEGRGDYPDTNAGSGRDEPSDADGDGPAGREVGPDAHRVREGETLSQIASDYGFDGWEELLELNPEVEDPDVILPGQILRILAIRRRVVEEGDTLSAIAREHGLDGWEELLELNPEVEDPDLIFPDQTLWVPED